MFNLIFLGTVASLAGGVKITTGFLTPHPAEAYWCFFTGYTLVGLGVVAFAHALI